MRVVHEWFSVELTRERNARLLAEAEERRLARLAPRKSIRTALRARVARRLFDFAVALEKEETWRAVWERLEAPRHP
jgi:hypothetical protein